MLMIYDGRGTHIERANGGLNMWQSHWSDLDGNDFLTKGEITLELEGSRFLHRL